MTEHECKAPDYCICNTQALGPDEECPVHGIPKQPINCMICGKFMAHPPHGIRKWFAKMEDHCVLIGGFTVAWEAKDIGFGQFYFYKDEVDGKVHCGNEIMSRDFIKKMLCKMVDECILDEPRNKETGE
jgi:hypothetical protein